MNGRRMLEVKSGEEEEDNGWSRRARVVRVERIQRHHTKDLWGGGGGNAGPR